MTWTIYINYKDALPDVWLSLAKRFHEYFGNYSYINYKDALPDVWLFIGQEVSEKKAFEYFGNIHVYSPGVVADQPLGSKVF